MCTESGARSVKMIVTYEQLARESVNLVIKTAYSMLTYIFPLYAFRVYKRVRKLAHFKLLICYDVLDSGFIIFFTLSYFFLLSPLPSFI